MHTYIVASHAMHGTVLDSLFIFPRWPVWMDNKSKAIERASDGRGSMHVLLVSYYKGFGMGIWDGAPSIGVAVASPPILSSARRRRDAGQRGRAGPSGRRGGGWVGGGWIGPLALFGRRGRGSATGN